MAFRMDLPDIGEGVVDAEVQRWFVAPGDRVAEDEPLVEVMTDKATVVISSPRRGRIVKLFWEVGDVAKVHAPLVDIEVEGDAPEERREEPSPPPRPVAERLEEAAPARAAAPGQKALAAPAVRALAREMGVDIHAVAGTGPSGRVTKDDLAAHRSRGNGRQAPERARPLAGAGAAEPIAEIRGGTDAAAQEERVPLRGIRKKIAENMARSKRTAAHFTFVEQVDVTELVRVKDRISEGARAEGVKVTFLPIVVKAAVLALRKHPKLNATMDEERGELVLHRRYDVGIASATKGGLVVPVLRGADRHSLLDLAREIERLGADSKAGRMRPEDLGRSTFTITSLGALGGLFATPVLNHPEVAILGLHRIRPTPVVKEGQVVVRDVMHLSVTSDHRVVDGHEAAAFAYEVIRYLEEPTLLFMQLA
jgi:pyruvate dehydrogenase E2 component (dihydrolipoamide acetyltransferase)